MCNNKRVLGIDPGLANTGFGVVDFVDGRYKMVSYGCITTSSKDARGERLIKIYTSLCAVIDEFQPQEAGMETLFFAQHRIKLGECRITKKELKRIIR